MEGMRGVRAEGVKQAPITSCKMLAAVRSHKVRTGVPTLRGVDLCVVLKKWCYRVYMAYMGWVCR